MDIIFSIRSEGSICRLQLAKKSRRVVNRLCTRQVPGHLAPEAVLLITVLNESY